MVKNLLVLRNKSSLVRTNEFFGENAVDFFSCPISYSESIKVDLANTQADIFLITSQNAYQAVLDNIEFFKNKKIYCLNKEIAHQFQNLNTIKQSWNNTKELASYIVENENSNQKIVHLCATNANKLFYKPLQSSGFDIDSINVYSTNFIKELDENIVNALKINQIKYIMIFSAASMTAMLDIFKSYSFDISNYKIICFSKKIAANISDYYAENSTLEDMLDLYLKLESNK